MTTNALWTGVRRGLADHCPDSNRGLSWAVGLV